MSLFLHFQQFKSNQGPSRPTEKWRTRVEAPPEKWRTRSEAPPKELCLRSRLFGCGGNCGVCLIFWRGGLLFPRGRSHIETATLSRATLKLPRLAGGRGFIKTPRPKLPRKGGTGGRVFHPCARPGRRVEGLSARRNPGPQTQERPAEYSAGL